MTQILDFGAFFSRSSDEMPENSELLAALARLPSVATEGPWLAGGALRRTLLRQSLDSDFDFFFASREQFDAFAESMKKLGAWRVSENEHNTTFRLPATSAKSVGPDEFEAAKPELVVQAITTRWYASLEEVIDSFDFTLCQFGYDGVRLVCGDYALWDLGRKRLVPHRLTYATASMRRLLKYTRQDFTICSGGLARMLELVLDDPAIVRAETQYID